MFQVATFYGQTAETMLDMDAFLYEDHVQHMLMELKAEARKPGGTKAGQAMRGRKARRR